MKNSEKYKTADERAHAFDNFCNGRTPCDKCKLNNSAAKRLGCAYAWLDLESAYDKIRDLERRVRAAWQTINRLDPRRCVPALKELDAVLNVSKFGEVGYGM